MSADVRWNWHTEPITMMQADDEMPIARDLLILNTWKFRGYDSDYVWTKHDFRNISDREKTAMYLSATGRSDLDYTELNKRLVESHLDEVAEREALDDLREDQLEADHQAYLQALRHGG